MTIDEAIAHALEMAGEQQERADSAELIDILDGLDVEACKECVADHRQLAEWLTELKKFREVYGICPSYEMRIPECKEGYNAQIAEYKRLLKVAVGDINFAYFCFHAACKNVKCEVRCPYYNKNTKACSMVWRYADEANKLIGDESNGI